VQKIYNLKVLVRFHIERAV